MKKHSPKTGFSSSLREFARSEKGIYAVMTGLLGVPLIGYIAFVVDGTGMLLDKARFTQGLEQAGLFLVAEDNQYRANKNIYQVNIQKSYPTAQQLKDMSPSERQATEQTIDRFNQNYQENYGEPPKAGEKRNLAYQQYQRNIQMVRELVQTYYLPEQAYVNQGITDDYVYHCGILAGGKVSALSQTDSIGCVVNGNFDRPSWLYWGSDYKKSYGTTFDRTTKIAADTIFVTKKKFQNFPMDVMFITDFSGSMTYTSAGTGNQRKIDVLRSVIGEMGDKILKEPQDPQQKSYNRVGFVDFAFGATPPDETRQCLLPYLVKDGSADFDVPSIVKKRKWVWSVGMYQDYYEENVKKERFNIVDRMGYELSQVEKFTGENTDFFYAYYYAKNWDLFDQKWIDYPNTLDMISHFNGALIFKPNMVKFGKNRLCFGKDGLYKETTKLWYKAGQSADLARDFARVNPEGATLSSAGLLIGANLMMNKNPESTNLTSNTQRSIIVLSDGFDTPPYQGNELKSGRNVHTQGFNHITETLLNPSGPRSVLKGTAWENTAGACERIRERLDSLQDPKYPILKSKISFISFGLSEEDRNDPTAQDQLNAWKHCVGETNYYEVNNRKELLEAFKKASGLSEEVGRSSDQAPTFK